MESKGRIIRKSLLRIIILIILVGIIFSLINSKKIINLTTQPNKISELITKKELKTVEINSELCEYEKSKNSDNIIIKEYKGNEESIIIPTEINGKKLDNIHKDAFKYCLNLETIKVPIELKEKVKDIKYFEENEENENEEYIELITTRKYSEAYLAYMNQTEEEKAILAIVPNKFSVPLEEVNSSEMQELYKVSRVNDTEMESCFDLRDYIYIEVEEQLGETCYAHATLTSVETNIALKREEIIDLSEVHAGFNTFNGYGGSWEYIEEYFNTDKGPVYEENWSIENLEKCTSIENAYLIKSKLNGGSITQEQFNIIQAEMYKTKQVEGKMNSIYFPAITYEDKKDETKKEEIQKARLQIKKHIKEYGSIYAAIRGSDTVKRYGKNMVANYSGIYRTDHAVSIIGWDDNFPKENFPEEIRPKNDGAYLILNSYGEDWGDEGCFWVSYEDRYIETELRGVISVTPTGENIKVKEFNIKNIDTNEFIKNNEIIKGINAKIQLSVEIINEIKEESLEVILKNTIQDFTSEVEINIENNNISINIPKSFKSGTYIIEIKYGEEVIAKTIKVIANVFNYTIIEDGQSIKITEYVGKEKEIEIPQEISGFKVIGIEDKAFYNNKILERITIYSNIEEIGLDIIQKGVIIFGDKGTAIETYANNNEYMFLEIGTEKIENEFWEFDIQSNTLLVKNKDIIEKDYKYYNEGLGYLFNRSIYYIQITDTPTKVGRNIFKGYINLKSVGNLSNIISIGDNAFYNCTNLINIGDLSNIISIGNSAFSGCINLANIGDLSKVKIIGNSVFSNCNNLINIGDLSNVTSIGNYAFLNCYNLKTSGKLSNVTSIGNYAFQNCTGIKELDLSNIISLSESVFFGCSNLKSIGNATKLEKIGKRCFYKCESLESINLANVENIPDNTFEACNNLTTVENLLNVTSIGNNAFRNCFSLKSLGNMSNVKSIGEFAFYRCTNLINIGDLSNIISIGNSAFSGCINLANIGELSNVTSIGNYAFQSCKSLNKITIGKNISDIGKDVFYIDKDFIIFGYRGTIAETYSIENNIKFIDLDSEKIITDIKITTLPKNKYIKGEELDLSGGKITVTYEDKSIEEIVMSNNEVEVRGYDKETLGKQKLTIIYQGKTAILEIKVEENIKEDDKEKGLVNIEIDLPSKVKYTKGEELDLTGLNITAIYNDGTKEQITQGYNVEGYSSNKVGKQFISISYKEYTKSYEIEIVEEVQENDSWKDGKEENKNEIVQKHIQNVLIIPPTKRIYKLGEEIDITGSKITAIYSDNTIEQIEGNSSLVKGYNKNKLGEQILTINYKGFKRVYEVEVLKKEDRVNNEEKEQLKENTKLDNNIVQEQNKEPDKNILKTICIVIMLFFVCIILKVYKIKKL